MSTPLVELLKAVNAVSDAESHLILAERRVARESQRARDLGATAQQVADARRLVRNAAADHLPKPPSRKGKRA